MARHSLSQDEYEAADDRRWWSKFEDTRQVDPVEKAAYDAICDERSDRQMAAYQAHSATFGPAPSARPINSWADCLCRRCMGATMVAHAGEYGAVWGTCPACFGTGVEGPYIMEAAR